MRRKTLHLSLALVGLVGLTSCGGGGGEAAKPNAAQAEAEAAEAEAAEAEAALKEALSKSGNGGGLADPNATDEEIEAALGTLLEGGLGQRGEKTKGEGKIRFLNLVEVDGKPAAIDVWWGRPDEKVKAASLAYEELSDSMSPMLTQGFTDNPSAVFTVTDQASGKELWTWDRWDPVAEDNRLTMFSPSDDGGFSSSDLELQPTKKSFDGKIVFPAADAGQVRMYWRSVGKALNGPNDSLLAVGTGGKCLTNGSGIAGPNGNQIEGSTFQVPAGTEMTFSAFPCDATQATVATVAAPAASGRYVLLAYKVAGAPKLLTIPAD